MLIKPLEQAAAAVSNKLIMPILDGIRFEVTADGLNLTGSDGFTTIIASIPADMFQSSSQGVFVLPNKKLIESVRRMDGEVTFQIGSGEVTVKAGKSELTMAALDAQDYPVTEGVIGKSLVINGKKLKEVIGRTAFAVADAKSQTPILSGLYFNFLGNKLCLIGCDMHRFASVTEVMDVDEESNVSFVLKKADVDKVLKLVTDKDDVHLSLGAYYLKVAIGRVTIIARLLDGIYPDTSKSVPKNFKTVVTVKTKELKEAIEFAAITAKDDKNKIIVLTVKEDIEIRSSGSSGKSVQNVEYDKIMGDSFKISFNCDYGLDAIGAIEHEFTTINTSGKGAPLVFRGEDREDETFLVLPYITRD